MLNSKGKWTTHISNFVRTSRRLYALRVIKSSFCKMIQIFYANSKFSEHCAPLFAGISATDALKREEMQNRFFRVLCHSKCVEYWHPFAFSLNSSNNSESDVSTFLRNCMKYDHILHCCRELAALSFFIKRCLDVGILYSCF